MRTILVKNIFTLLGALLFSYLFVVDQLGLNVLLFSTLLFLGQIYFDCSALAQVRFRWIISAHLFSAFMVVWHQSLIAQVMYVLSFLLWVGYSQLPGLRFLWYGMLLGIGSIMTAPLSVGKAWQHRGWQRIGYWSQLLLFPLVLGGFFFGIYYEGNAQFAALFDGLFSWLDGWHPRWNAERPLLFVLGLLCLGALLWPSVLRPLLAGREAQWQMALVRQRRKSFFSPSMLSLKRHYFAALLSLGVLNGLLLLANLLDLRFVWLDFSEKSAAQLSDFVHEGTNLLIIAILLAIAVVLYFFWGNLNFYPDRSHRLRQLAYIWLLQNAVLALSIGFRNYHYLHAYGLTGLRIGVMIFLLMVLAGLYFSFRKIRDKRSIYYLLSANSWAILVILTVACAFNWTTLITQHHLKYLPVDRLDLTYLGEQLPAQNALLLKNYRVNSEDSTVNEWLDSYIRAKTSRLEERYAQAGWRGWNRAEAKVRRRIAPAQ